jgi:hypothetical protein
MIENQQVVGEVAEYAKDGVFVTDDMFFAWAYKKNGLDVFTAIFEEASDSDCISIGNILTMLCAPRDEKKNSLYISPSDIRDTAAADNMRATLKPLLKKRYMAECQAFFDNGGDNAN